MGTEGLTTSKEQVAQPEASKSKPDGISLPITEMTDDWMDDDVAIGSIESDEEETGADKTTSYAKVECQVVPTNDQTHKNVGNKDLCLNLANDSFWSNKYLFDDAEAKFYAQRRLLVDTSTSSDGSGKKRKDG